MSGTFETHLHDIFVGTSVRDRPLARKWEDGGRNMTYVCRVD